MKQVLIMCLMLTGCGGLPMGQDGVDGRSPKCSVVKKDDGKTYLKCINPDGTAAEAEIHGDAGEGAESLAQCSFKSEVYLAHYNVLTLADESRLASLYVKNLKTPTVYFQGAVLHAQGDEAYGSAEIKLSGFSAKLFGDKKAEITQVGSVAKEMVCK